MENIIVISNLIGVVALLFWVLSIQSNQKKTILIRQLIANVLYAIQYILIGAVSAGIMNIVSMVRSGTFYKIEEKQKRNPVWVLLLFCFMAIGIGLCICKKPLDWIPIALTLIYTYTTWQKNNKVLRCGFIVAGMIWIYYNLTVKAYVPIIGNVLEVISGIIAICRLDRKKTE